MTIIGIACSSMLFICSSRNFNPSMTGIIRSRKITPGDCFFTSSRAI
jgi:hypothetical protein